MPKKDPRSHLTSWEDTVTAHIKSTLPAKLNMNL